MFELVHSNLDTSTTVRQKLAMVCSVHRVYDVCSSSSIPEQVTLR